MQEVVPVVMCMLRVENTCDGKKGMCVLLGGRSELQSNSCRTVWYSFNGTRQRNGERVALGRAELGWM